MTLQRPELQKTMAREKRESMLSVPWHSADPPKKILIIRLQALGDVVITLPYLQAFRASLPFAKFHFLTREEFSDIPDNIKMFEKVYRLGGGRDNKRQFMKAIPLVPLLRKENYDIVLDLQRNIVSRLLRIALHPRGYSEFDRFSDNSAGERNKSAIEKLRLNFISEPLPRVETRDEHRGINKLDSAKYNAGNRLIVLNPAGNFVTKNWPIENYARFAYGWIEQVDRDAQFLVLGTDTLRDKALFLKKLLGDKLIALIGETTQSEAYNILQKAELVVSEDSGLMHMAWVSRIPVIALFGSTKSVWSKPLGPWSVCLDSSDLECGECSQPICKFGDVRCLARQSPDSIIQKAAELLRRKKATEGIPA
jgi:heptosyltransferase II